MTDPWSDLSCTARCQTGSRPATYGLQAVHDSVGSAWGLVGTALLRSVGPVTVQRKAFSFRFFWV